MSAEDALAKLERQVLAAAGIADWLKRTDTLRKLIAAQSPDVRNLVLAMVAPRVEAQALAALLDAFGLGANDALDILDDMGVEPVTRLGRPSRATRDIVAGLDRAGREAMLAAHRLAAVGAPLDAVTAPIFGHANRVRGSVSDGINAAGNEGSTAIADAAGLATVWVAETDACVHCLAYSGKVAKPGEPFPAGLTFGRKSYRKGPVMHPPLHPRCRCTVEPLRSVEYAAALQREAQRSVLRGFSLQSESMSVRIDAADRLVKAGVDAPKSVIAYARRSVKAGEFATRGRPRK